MNTITIIDFLPEHQPYFDAFNREWIQADFEVEPVDEYVMSHPKEAILDKGGAILMALYEGEPAGTVGLKKINDELFEFTKMAVGKNFRRKGIGEALSYASFTRAAELGAKNILLYSNTLNAAAIKLYEKLGFHHLPVEQDVYKRANVKMLISVEDALEAASRYYQGELKQ
jgi:ribosomal protein S18 acetylase RimI-like enzyme